MNRIDYKIKGASATIELPDKFVIPFYGSTMCINIIHTGEHGTAFISHIDGSEKSPKRHFVSNEVFVQSYGKYAICKGQIIQG